MTMISVDGVATIAETEENERLTEHVEEKSVEIRSIRTRTLPSYKEPQPQTGWTKMKSPEGAIYYSNEITKTTQWTPPPHLQDLEDRKETEPFIEMKNVPSHGRVHGNSVTDALSQPPNANADPKTLNPIPTKVYVIWIIALVLSIIDFITDIQIVIVWFNMSSYCPQFSCYTYNDNSSFIVYALPLALCSTSGFIAKMFIQYLQLKLFYASCKKVLTQDEFEQKTHDNWRLILKYGWLPLIIQDAVSIVLLNFTLFFERAPISMSDLQDLYHTCMIFSLLNIVFALIFAHRKKKQFVKLNLFPEVMACFRGWCCCLCCCFVPLFTGLLLVYGIASVGMHKWAYVDIIDYSDYTSNNPYGLNGDFSTATCPSYVRLIGSGQWTMNDHQDVPKVSNNSFAGNLTETPLLVYPNCSGDDYIYDMECYGHRGDVGGVVNGMNLRCTLNWKYHGIVANHSHCVNSEQDVCGFHIDFGVCEDFVIQCDNNWEFASGNALMWACFQECALR